jgi:pyrroloquinoline-quinone synthase
MDLFAQIDRARREFNVLEHPFYERWSAGTLSEQELDVYARQYRHAVLALAEASQALARRAAGGEHAAGLQRHAEEEGAHIELWDRFAAAATAAASADAESSEAECADAAAHSCCNQAGESHSEGVVGSGEGVANRTAALPETDSCVRAWTAGEDELEQLAVLYAIEAGQPDIARTKLEGLVERYGYSEEGPATEYFRLHSTLDVEHAEQARRLIERLMSESEQLACEQAERMVARARAALSGYWELLDGVERECAAD